VSGDCLSLVAFLLTAFTVHGYVPDSFRRSTIVPIPKGHNVNKSDSANFRGITLGSIFAMRKLLAICEDYAREYSISFNALKSKCLVASPKNCHNTFKKSMIVLFTSTVG